MMPGNKRTLLWCGEIERASNFDGVLSLVQAFLQDQLGILEQLRCFQNFCLHIRRMFAVDEAMKAMNLLAGADERG
jgi:hypothetical protein